MNKKIFIVEDDEGIREALQELLESVGYSVETAGDGREALCLLKKTPGLPSLILLDLMLPHMDGYQFRQVQGTDPRLKGIPVVITTAGGDIESKSQKVGAEGSLRKPFDLDEVLATVARFAR
ncbi:MAG TPA: response regulator [Bdellovibrionota bacterium]|jgi:CheY-like chemotaxis protein|nr:response regulator [Bdellovibrionota bacterium]